MKIGFTGTSKIAIPEAQLLGVLNQLNLGDELHFGDCINADAQVWSLAIRRGIWTIAHPPADPKLRARCAADEVREPRPYIQRNHDIVNECDHLVAAPRTYLEEMRSGTWATVRYAALCGKSLAIVWPNGATTYDASPRELGRRVAFLGLATRDQNPHVATFKRPAWDEGFREGLRQARDVVNEKRLSSTQP
jgi:hypothetical protein